MQPQLHAVAKTLRRLLGPKAILYLNECASSREWSFAGMIPPELDLISVDLYANLGSHEVAEVSALPCNFSIGGRAIPCNRRAIPCNIRRKGV